MSIFSTQNTGNTQPRDPQAPGQSYRQVGTRKKFESGRTKSPTRPQFERNGRQSDKSRQTCRTVKHSRHNRQSEPGVNTKNFFSQAIS